MRRRYSIGAEVLPDGGVHFRVWAPRRKVEVVWDGGEAVELEREPGGYRSGVVRGAGHGTRYRFRLDGGDSFPDPASRFQPEGPHGSSQVVDPARFEWRGARWRGVSLEGQAIEEIHIGTFTREGTWEAAARKLPDLLDTGITVVELMPVADFPGRFGWGYDGVGWFAPVAIYGEPDDFRRFVDLAHRAGMGVVLDVVYNHLGPDGNYLRRFSEDYFTDRYHNAWGEALNFDDENSAPMRELAVSSAACWIEEYHLDGLRLDATHQIFDSSPESIMTAIGRRARQAAGGREIFIMAEHEFGEARLVREEARGGFGLDALWNDDWHHSARVAVTGRREGYYAYFQGRPQELISAVKYGRLYQGQRYSSQSTRHGSPCGGLRPAQFVSYLDNHDQISNSGLGARIHQLTSPGRYRAITALLLLSPSTPLLFQGQEFAASSPFYYFADHSGELRRMVAEGRMQWLAEFRSLAQPEMRAWLPDPGDPATFEKCKLDWSEREKNAGILAMHRDLLRLRREDRVFRAQKPGAVDGAVLAEEAFLLRFFGGNGDDRLLLVNLGPGLRFEPAPEPLLGPPELDGWALAWSSEDPRYGGGGTAPPLDDAGVWRLPGHAAVVMRTA